jgi:hypothetical protein
MGKIRSYCAFPILYIPPQPDLKLTVFKPTICLTHPGGSIKQIYDKFISNTFKPVVLLHLKTSTTSFSEKESEGFLRL